MMKNNFLFTSESVTEGHPDKICDLISDSILDAILAIDKDARVACETMITTARVIVSAEITANAKVDYADIVYIGGGNTKSMLAVFREWGLDKILINAYHSGKILAGVSAGAICWFTQGVTDSWAHGLRAMDCMNVLDGCCCPHYDGEKNRRPSVLKFLKENKISSCFAIEDGAALHYKNHKNNIYI